MWGDIGSWLTSGTSPWWAAILTFVLGQRFSVKSAKEQREADSADRQQERDQAFKVLEAQHKADKERLAAEHQGTLQLEADRYRRENAAAAEEREYATAVRASQATATLRAEIAAKFLGSAGIDPEVVHAFMQASEEMRFKLDDPIVMTIQREVQQFVTVGYNGANPLARVNQIDSDLAYFSESLSQYRYFTPEPSDH